MSREYELWPLAKLKVELKNRRCVASGRKRELVERYLSLTVCLKRTFPVKVICLPVAMQSGRMIIPGHTPQVFHQKHNRTLLRSRAVC